MAAQRRGSVKVLVQPAEGLVGGDGDAVLLLAFGEDLEEEFGASAVEFHVAELIGAEQPDAAVAGDRPVRLLLVGGLHQLVQQLGGERVAEQVTHAPAGFTVTSPKSTSASMPGWCVCGMNAPVGALPDSTRICGLRSAT